MTAQACGKDHYRKSGGGGMDDLELRLYAIDLARETEGEKASTDEVLRAADEIFYWLRHGVFEVCVQDS